MTRIKPSPWAKRDREDWIARLKRENSSNAKLDDLAERYDKGEFTKEQYLAEITKACK